MKKNKAGTEGGECKRLGRRTSPFLWVVTFEQTSKEERE